jgi:hypothetical protein
MIGFIANSSGLRSLYTFCPATNQRTAMNKKPTDKAVQGEGDYVAGKRYQNAVRNFTKTANVDKAARDAAPQSDKEAKEMNRAEQAGASRSKGEGSLVSSKKGKGV